MNFIDDFLGVRPDRELRVRRFLIGEVNFVGLNPLERRIKACCSFEFDLQSRLTNAEELKPARTDPSSPPGGCVWSWNNDAAASPFGTEEISCRNVMATSTEI